MVVTSLTQFASGSAPSGDLLGALGIDVGMLVFQAIAFVILVFVMGKWVYPIFVKIVDERQEKIEASVKAADEAQKQADEAKTAVGDLMAEARKEAAEIVATAKREAEMTLETADSKAKTQAEQIVADAKSQIEKDVIAAKKALHNETLALVAEATEAVIGKVVTPKIDEAVVAAAIKGVK